ncbi:27437_t:CDS:2, partial [Racocetra persica]
RKYCGMRFFAEIRKPDSSERFRFARDVEVIASNETGEGDINKTNPLLERYGGNKCYWVHIKHPISAIYFTREINYMDFFGCNSKNEKRYHEAILAFFKEHYAFVPDPTWLSKHKKTKKYTKKSLVGTNISTLVSNRPSKYTREIVDIENERE